VPVPVLLALTLVGGIAAVVFLGSRRRLSTWLLIGSVGLFVAGCVMWAHEPAHRHAPTTAVGALVPAVRLAPAEGVTGDVYAAQQSTDLGARAGVTITFTSSDAALPVDTGSGPDHRPAFAVLALGGAVGLIGLVLRRRTPRAEA
jgi:hypothetical protein